jgi:hypothetical protein
MNLYKDGGALASMVKTVFNRDLSCIDFEKRAISDNPFSRHKLDKSIQNSRTSLGVMSIWEQGVSYGKI